MLFRSGISMDIRVNDTLWHIQFKKPTSSELKRSDGTIVLVVLSVTPKLIVPSDRFNSLDVGFLNCMCHNVSLTLISMLIPRQRKCTKELQQRTKSKNESS